MNVPLFEQSAMAKLDLKMVEAKLIAPTPQGMGWKPAEAKKAIALYRRFLWLHMKYPRGRFSPSRAIDAVWHTHILFTKDYIDDCHLLFGQMLHHNPLAAMATGGEKRELERQFQKTKDLFEEHFSKFDFGEEGLCDSGYCDSVRKDFNDGHYLHPA